MNVFARRVLAIEQIAGGVAGLVLVQRALRSDSSLTHPVFSVVFAVIFLFGVVAGVMLLEKHPRAIEASRMFQLAQIPAWASPIVGYELIAGAGVFLTFGEQIGFTWLTGSRFSLYFFLDVGFSFKINLLAVALTVFLGRCMARSETERGS